MALVNLAGAALAHEMHRLYDAERRREARQKREAEELASSDASSSGGDG